VPEIDVLGGQWGVNIQINRYSWGWCREGVVEGRIKEE